VAKPMRADRERARAVKLWNAQAAALQAANTAYDDSPRRFKACLQQRSGSYDAVLPLSPTALPCVSPHCKCQLSHRQLKTSLGLHSPSQSVDFKCKVGKAGQAAACKRAEESAAKATADQAEVEAAAGALLRMPRRAAASPTGSPRLQSFDGSPLGLFGINLLSQFATIVGFCGDD